MADLGAIGELLNQDYLVAYSLENNANKGFYQIDGTTEINSVPNPVYVWATLNNDASPIFSITSSPLGEFTVTGIPYGNISIMGYDLQTNKQTKAVTVKPDTISFSEIAETGWDAVNSGSSLTVSGQTITNNDSNSLAETAISDIKHEHRPFYVDFLVNSVNGSGGVVGLATVDATSPDVILGESPESIGWYDNGDVKVNNVIIDTIGSWIEADILTVYYEKGNVWFSRNRAGVITYYGNVIAKNTPIHSFPTGYTFGYAATPYNLNDEFIVSGLLDTITAPLKQYIPWEAIDE